MVALIDCNSFYCSCERLFRPDLRHKPVVVLSNNDGCAIALTDEAKALGIKMGTPAHMIDQETIKKHGVTMFSSNYTLYGDLSQRVMQTIGEFVPRMEIYSIDEAFADLSGIRIKDLEPLALKMRAAILQNIGIPVSIGIARTKTLAKMANRFAKKTKKQIGVHVAISQSQVNEILTFTEVGDVWGVGRQYQKKLIAHGITTAMQFSQLPLDWVLKEMTVVGIRTLKEMQQTPCIEWEFQASRKKNICTSRSFGTLLTDKKTIAEALSNYAVNCALKLRLNKSCAKAISIFIHTNPFRSQDKQYSRSINLEFPVATADTTAIVKYALKGLDIIYASGYNFLKVGVNVSELVPENEVQYGMFDTENRHRSQKLMGTMDKINATFGRNTLQLAVQSFDKKWKMRQNMLSQKFTTDISQILTINI